MWAYPRLFSVISNSMEHMDSSLLGPKVPRVSLPTRIFRGDQTRNLRISQNLSIPGTWGINGTGLTRPSNFLNYCQFSTSPDPPGALRRVPAASQNGHFPTRMKPEIGLPEIALPVLLLPAVNCQCKTNSRFKFTCGRLPVYVCLC